MALPPMAFCFDEKENNFFDTNEHPFVIKRNG